MKAFDHVPARPREQRSEVLAGRGSPVATGASPPAPPGLGHRFADLPIRPAAIPSPAPAPAPVLSPTAPIQARWIKVEGSGDPGDYYWEGRGAPEGTPPNGGNAVPRPALDQLPDTHSARRGGSMKSLRTDPDRPTAALDNLAFVGSQAFQEKGSFYTGPTESRGLGPRQVQTSVPDRDSGEHTRIFRGMTGGESSSTQYQRNLGTAAPNTSYEILHGMGFGEGGQQTQSSSNLASASSGANTEMIPFDKAISGNPNVDVDTSFDLRSGTHRAERIRQTFSHKDFPEDPFHRRLIDADRPRPTLSEYEALETQAARFEPKNLEAAAGLISLSRSAPAVGMDPTLDEAERKRQKLPERPTSVQPPFLGFAKGNHPFDPRRGNDDDDPTGGGGILG